MGRGEATPGGLYQVAVTGTKAPERLTTVAADTFHITGSWTPDGRHLLSTQRTARADQWSIIRFTLGESIETEPLLSGAYSPALSPNGQWLAHASAEGSSTRVYVRPYPNVNEARIPVSGEAAALPSWSRDGRELFFSPASGVMVVPVEYGKTLTLGKPRPLRSGADPLGPPRIVAVQSSRRILVARPLGNAVAAGPSEIRAVLGFGEDVKARVPVTSAAH